MTSLLTTNEGENMQITSQDMSLKSGKVIKKYLLSNSSGMQVEVLNVGATLTKIIVPDEKGNYENVILEWEDINLYENNPGNFGATVGRVAGRIYQGKVTIDDKTYHFPQNTFENTLHGGINGFHTKIWEGEVTSTDNEAILTLHYLSKDGEEGFPGNLNVKAYYILKEDNSLTIKYEATTDQTTVVNLTNHAYFNLSGETKRSILDQEVYINSDRICDLDHQLIPTGEIINLDEEPAFDFRTPKAVKTHIDMDNQHLKNGCGYDHCWLLKETGKAAELYDPISKRCMSITTNAPGVVVYTMNHADGITKLSNGLPQQKRYGICFETQKKPIGYNEVFKEEVILKPGEIYGQETVFKFSIR